MLTQSMSGPQNPSSNNLLYQIALSSTEFDEKFVVLYIFVYFVADFLKEKYNFVQKI